MSHTKQTRGERRRGASTVALLHNMLRVLYLRRSRFGLWLRLGRGARGLLLRLLHASISVQREERVREGGREKNKGICQGSVRAAGRPPRCVPPRETVRASPSVWASSPEARLIPPAQKSITDDSIFLHGARTGRCSRTAPLLVTSMRGVRPGRRSDASSRSLGTGIAGRPDEGSVRRIKRGQGGRQVTQMGVYDEGRRGDSEEADSHWRRHLDAGLNSTHPLLGSSGPARAERASRPCRRYPRQRAWAWAWALVAAADRRIST